MNNDLVRPGERVDDLQFMNLRIIQSPDAFRFGMDAVLLADFARVRKNSRIKYRRSFGGKIIFSLCSRERFSMARPPRG